MLLSLCATLAFSCSIVSARRAASAFGSLAANFLRLALATLLLALYAHVFGYGISGPSLSLFFVSGIIGFGLGDVALFLSVSRIGPRLTILLTQTLAAPFAAVIEWIWLGTRLSAAQMLCGGVILCGTALAVSAPRQHLDISTQRRQTFGLFCGVLSALGQGCGAVVSRKAFAVAETVHFPIDGITAAYQRILGGVLVAGIFWLTVATVRGRTRLHLSGMRSSVSVLKDRSALWVLSNALCGPVIGVSFFQWALKTTPSGIVLPIVATTPIVAMPLTYWLDGDRPSRLAVIGALIAVGGVIGLMRV